MRHISSLAHCVSVKIFLSSLWGECGTHTGFYNWWQIFFFFFFVPVQPTVFLHYKLSEDHLNVTCSANARPAPMISWKVSGSGIENSTKIVSHPNGTTSVISILQIKDPKRQVGKDVICQVLHLGTVTDYRETVNKGKRGFLWYVCGHTPARWCMLCRACWPLSREADKAENWISRERKTELRKLV